MKNKESKISFIFQIIFIALLEGICIWFLIAQNIYPSEQDPADYYVSELNDDWYHIHGNDERVPMTVPGKCNVEPGYEAIFERTLPDDIAPNMWLCFRTSRQDMQIYIADELRGSFSTINTRPFGLASASTYLFIQLNSSDSGKLISVHTVSDSTYSGVMRTVLYGDKMGILLNIFKEISGDFLTLGQVAEEEQALQNTVYFDIEEYYNSLETENKKDFLLADFQLFRFSYLINDKVAAIKIFQLKKGVSEDMATFNLYAAGFNASIQNTKLNFSAFDYYCGV